MLDFLIVGGGIHGTYLAHTLIHGKGIPAHTIRILDPHPRLLNNWYHHTTNVGMAYFDGGRFRQRVDGSWIEEDVGGATREFQESARTADSVTLTDGDTRIRIDTTSMQILQARGNGAFAEIHAITGLDTYVSPRAG